LFKIIVQSIAIILALAVIGYYPALTVAATAVSIVILFLFFGKE